MSIRIIRKALGLLIVDIVLIIGIFVLQFRADSSIIEKIGNLQFTFSQIEDRNQNLIVQNKFRMTYNGLVFHFDDQTPAISHDNDNNQTSLKLTSWQKNDALTYELFFDNDVKLTFELASDSPNASLAVVAELPSSVSDFAIPYSFASNMRLQNDDSNRFILNNKKTSWELSTHAIDSGYFYLTKHSYIATYSEYNETQKFTFDSIVDLPIADVAYYQQNIERFKNNLIAAYKANTAESNLSEQVVVSYVAAQAENGNYAKAIEDIPANLKKSKQRTFLSAPYLNTLEEMNTILQKTITDYEKKIADSSASGSLDIFTVHNIANYLCLHSNPEVVKTLLQKAAAADITQASIAQATGLLQVFADLNALDSAYAQYLLPAMEPCVERITESCKFEGNNLTISENDTFLSVIQAVETGVAVMRYGYISDNSVLQKAGYVLVNSYLTENASYDLRTLSNLYPIIAYDNWYYPHFTKLKTNNGDMWAWTCAKSITCETDAEGSITLTIDFPENLTHYIMVKGVPGFTSIYIYNMAFRTDPRFETYNSSGYVYKSANKMLLLKSRHKQQFETVRLTYTEKPVTPAPAAKETASEKAEEKTVTVEAENTATETSATPADATTETTEVEAVSVPAESETDVPAVEAAVVEETAPVVESEVAAPVEETTTKKKKKKK